MSRAGGPSPARTLPTRTVCCPCPLGQPQVCLLEDSGFQGQVGRSCRQEEGGRAGRTAWRQLGVAPASAWSPGALTPVLGPAWPERMGQEGSRGLRGRKPQLPGHPAFIHSLIHSLIHPLVQTDICVHVTQMRSLICSCVPGGTRLEALKHRPLGGKLRGQVARTAQLGAHVPQGWTQSHSGEWRPWEGPSEASVLQTHIFDFHRMNTEVTRGLHHEGGNI